MPGRLTLCATPIGNLDDASPRLASTLGAADVVFAEDTRRTGTLLTHLGVHTTLRSFYAGNERQRLDELRGLLEQDHHVALVSDAGMPTVSDPGARAVELAVSVGATVSAVPGPSAVTTAIAVSGFPADRFLFLGFLGRRGRERASDVDAAVASAVPVVLFAAPSRIHDDLAAIGQAGAGDRQIVIARELTKLHEEVWRGTVDEAVEVFSRSDRRRGEFTVVLDAAPVVPASMDDALVAARAQIAEGASPSDAVRSVAGELGVSRRELYDRVVKGDR